jgi:hypothetical protein
VRLYRQAESARFTTRRDIDAIDIDLEYDAGAGRFTAEYLFEEYGHFDYLVFRKKKKSEWVHHAGTSGRINVIPDVRGEIILEIFPISTGTRVSTGWTEAGIPVLCTTSTGGHTPRRFSDITYHLDDLIRRYRITALYLLGVQKRGANREDWAPRPRHPLLFRR